VNATVGALDRAGASAEAGAARAAGFTCVKVKVGTGDDAGRVAAVRAAAGPGMALRIDANGAWSVPEARAALRVLAPAGLELCEEPVGGADAVAELGRTLETPVALAIDETTAEPRALDRRVCAAACLKLARSGGVSGLVREAARARRAGYEVYLASTFDGPLGIAAALHAGLAVGVERPCGLATIDLFTRGCPALAVRDGTLRPPAGPGLGDGLRDWY
jgi:L-alanine-DL-glutamate epimerase-like enolase superfamily enzyme